ncbi:hypothetical protein UCRPC4_g03932 [Phaeomoniella chlamydospora]|uniref:Uncharacterized protein n=1 Tax=Phaeomoniella chlamydospora TaxID=158046 RepID=A0A0G2GW56_PHACM|nr:hypothetical protein UCRPC4_g03932 [Phaeomoniella chlamydospora]
MAVSDTASNGGHGHPSEGNSGDPLMADGSDRPVSGEAESVGALGSAPAAGTQQNRDINRGPSNASSAYTGHAQSEASEEGDRSPNGGYTHPYYDEGTYYNDAQPQHGPYGDGSYGGNQPIIRDVQARRNTRIEKPTVFPQQGNAGISQNF